MQTTDEKIYDLNLSANYVPDWGAWEIGREVISNAIDADPKQYRIEVRHSDLIYVYTNTWPKLKEIKIIGCGSKKSGGDTIGQFGEGFKMAALACCRAGGKMGIYTPDYTAEFFMREEDEEQVLSMRVKEAQPGQTDCHVYIGFTGIAEAVANKFHNFKVGPVPRANHGKLTIYLKGVFIQQNDQRCLFDWNLGSADISRDRNLLSVWSVSREVCEWLDANMSPELARDLTKLDSKYFEIESMNKWPERFGSAARQMLIEAIEEREGVDRKSIALASEETDLNRRAEDAGKKVIKVSDGLASIIKRKDDLDEDGIDDTKQLVKTGKTLAAIPIKEEWDISDMDKIIAFIFDDAIDIKAFQNYPGAEDIFCYRSEDESATLWVNEAFFLSPGSREEKAAEVLMALCNIRGEGSLNQKKISDVAAKFAIMFIDGIIVK